MTSLCLGESGWSVPLRPELDGPSTVVWAFCAREAENSRGLTELLDAFPRSHIVGCSTAGEITGTRVCDGALAVAVSRFEAVRVRSASARIAGAVDSVAAGAAIGRDLAAEDLQAIFVLSDGLKVNGTDLVRGLTSEVPAATLVSGGLAGDGSRFARTWVLDGQGPRVDAVVAVGLYGAALRSSHGSRGGWDIFGPARRVTRARGNVLFELDGEPALDLYKRYLGERAQGLPATALLFPLGVRAADWNDARLVRTVLSVDEATRSMTFAGDIPEGSTAQLMRANFDRLVEGAGKAGRGLTPSDGTPRLVVAISCVGRRLVLGERTEEELEAVADAVGPDAAMVGFYSYGEIAPSAAARCDLHNQTITLSAWWEVP
jgi:hypothetical protein